MREFKYRIIGNGYHEHHSVPDFGGEDVGLKDTYNRPIYEGDWIEGYDIMLKDYIKGKVEYIPPTFCIRMSDGYHQSLDKLIEIHILKY